MKVPTTLGYTILGLLAGGAMSGYDIRRQFATTPLGFYSDSPGAIYPALRRLGAEGLAASRPDPKALGRARELWSLTPDGRRCYRQWLATPPTVESLQHEHDAEIMKFSHLAELGDPAVIDRFLAVYREVVQSQIDGVQSFLGSLPAALPWTSLRAVELGLETLRLRVRWATSSRRPHGRRT